MKELDEYIRTTEIDIAEGKDLSEYPIYPIVYGFERCDKRKKPIRYDKDCFTIHFVVEGEGMVNEEGGKQDTIVAKSCFLLSPHCHSVYAPSSNNPWVYFWVEFSGEDAGKIMDQSGLDVSQGCAPLTAFSSILEVFKLIFIDQSSNLNNIATCLSYESGLFSLLSIITEEYGTKRLIKEESITSVNVNKILIYFEKNISSPGLNISSTARAFGYAPSYISRIVKEKTGETPSHCLTSIRMKKAAMLLTKHSLPISRVAILVGYKNQFYFSKEFKRFYGVRPSKYSSSND